MKTNRVGPIDVTEQRAINNMEVEMRTKKTSEALEFHERTFDRKEKLKDIEERTDKKLTSTKSGISTASLTLKASNKWKHYRRSTRIPRVMLKAYEKLNLFVLTQSKCNNGLVHGNSLSQGTYGFLTDDSDAETMTANKVSGGEGVRSDAKRAVDKALLHYFVTMAISKDESKCIDFDFVVSLLKSGADINCGDQYGQTVMHEIARTWHTDVAAFFIEHGADVNAKDYYGRTPLHVAAAVDYPKMVSFLFMNGANLHARTIGENQSPVHYAAKNDACKALEELLLLGARVDDRDFKGRSTIQIAAELDRSEACNFLVDYGAPCGVRDNSGMSAISLMISKMPNVALKALDQFHITDRANRLQYFYLNFIEADPALEFGLAKGALHEAVVQKQFSIIMHPVLQRITEIKWKSFARYGVWLHTLGNLVICIAWTVLVCLQPRLALKAYMPLKENWYRVVFEVIVLIGFLLWIKEESKEYLKSKRDNDTYVKWREAELTKDLPFCHPRWPEERAYLEREIKILRKQTPAYLVDWWNYFDWITYASVIAMIVCHITNVLQATPTTHKLESRFGALMLFFLWLRMMKFVRAFKVIGPFVVMLQHVLSDSIKIAFLFFEIYIPYAAAFWVIFGVNNISGYSDPQTLFYNLLQISVLGDYSFDSLASFDKTMAQLLCGTYIVFSGIVCLNLFIALLSDTFQRVHDNAKATALMLRAATILSLESHLPRKRLLEMKRQIHEQFAPEMLCYDDDVTSPWSADVKRMTFKIKEELERIENKFNRVLKQNEWSACSTEDSPQQKLSSLVSRIDSLQSKFDDHLYKFTTKLDQLSESVECFLLRTEEERGKSNKEKAKLIKKRKNVLADIMLPPDADCYSTDGNQIGKKKDIPQVRVMPLPRE